VDAICIRDVLEATGFQVRIVRLLGVYSCPHRLEESTDGHRDHMVVLNVEAEAIGAPSPSATRPP
jgi:ADP-ribose pyrophosphatase YjhB (NUDIX family)